MSEDGKETIELKPYTLVVEEKNKTITYSGGEVRQPLTVVYPTLKGVRVIKGHAVNGNLTYIQKVIINARILKMKQEPIGRTKNPVKKKKAKIPKVQ